MLVREDRNWTDRKWRKSSRDCSRSARCGLFRNLWRRQRVPLEVYPCPLCKCSDAQRKSRRRSPVFCNLCLNASITVLDSCEDIRPPADCSHDVPYQKIPRHHPIAGRQGEETWALVHQVDNEHARPAKNRIDADKRRLWLFDEGLIHRRMEILAAEVTGQISCAQKSTAASELGGSVERPNDSVPERKTHLVGRLLKLCRTVRQEEMRDYLEVPVKAGSSPGSGCGLRRTCRRASTQYWCREGTS